MSVLLTRGTRLSQPQGPVEVDWANPLAIKLGLISIWTPDFVFTKTNGLRQVGFYGSKALGKYGVGRAGNGTSTSVLLPPGALSCTSISGNTFGSRFALLRIGAANASRSISGSGNGTNSWRINSGGSLSLVFTGSNVVYSSSSIVSANEYCSLGVSTTGSSGSSVLVVKNGVQVASGTTSGVTGNGGLSPYLGQNGASSQYYDGEIYLHCSFENVLSAADFAVLDSNPWQLFKPVQRRVWFDAAVDGAGSHTLTGANSTQSNTGTTAAIAQAHALTGANSVQANTAGTGSIGSDITLAGAAGSSANTGSVGAIGQVHVLVGAASAQANGGSTGTITQVHALAGASATQANVGSTAALGETVITLAGSAGSSANTGSTGAITQAHVLIGAASVQDNVAAASAIVQAHVLAGANAVQSNLGSVGAITAFDFSTAASPYVALVPYTNHIAFVPAVSNTAMRGL